jgi:hypothetical protein
MTMRITFGAISVFLILPFSAWAQNAVTATTSTPEDDCKVIAAVIKHQPVGPLDSGSYGTDCNWDKFGISETIDSGKGKWLNGFSHPRYASDGLHVTVGYASFFLFTDTPGAGAHNYQCILEKQSKQDENWSVVACSAGAIAD